MAHKEEEDEALHSPPTPSPSSVPLENLNRLEFILPLEGMGSGQNVVDQLGVEHSSVSKSGSPVSATQENLVGGATATFPPDAGSPKTDKSRKKVSPVTSRKSRWKEKKIETLSQHFNPIPFLPNQRGILEIAQKHKRLLTEIGLWEYLNLDFGHELQTDLIKELVVGYIPNRNRSSVQGISISLGPAALADALSLRARRLKEDGKFDKETGYVMVTQEEASFLEELIRSCLVLNDDEKCEVDEGHVPMFPESRKGMRFQNAYWAGLIWNMVKSELSKGKRLCNCYYASHLQLLLKHQVPKLFEMEEEEDIVVKCCKRRRSSLAKGTKDKNLCSEEDAMADCEREKPGLKQRVEDTNQSKVVLDAMKHASDSDIALGGTNNYQESNSENCLKWGEEITQVTENDFQGYVESHDVEEGKKAEVMDLDDKAWSLVHCNQEHGMQDKEKVTGCEGQFGSSHEMKHEKEVDQMEDRATDVESKADVDTSIDMNCEEKNVVVEDNANEAASKAIVGGSLDVQSGQEDDVLQDEGNEAACEANIGYPLDVPCKKDDYLRGGMASEDAFEANGRGSLELQCEELDNVMYGHAYEAACEANIGYLLEVACKEDDYLMDDYVMEDKASETALGRTFGDSVDMQCKKGDNVMENNVNKAASESDIGGSLDLHREKHGFVVEEDQANESASEAKIVNSPDLPCKREDCVMEDKGNAAAYGFNIKNSLGEELQIVQVDVISDEHDSECVGALMAGFRPEEPCEYTKGSGGHHEQLVCGLNEVLAADMNGFGADMNGFGAETERTIDYGGGSDHGIIDLDTCSAQVQLWIEKLHIASRVQANHESNTMLLKKIEKQERLLRQYETKRKHEQLEKQKVIYRYEREVKVMQDILQGYRNSLKEVNNSFTRYRERCQLPDESLYMPHPSGRRDQMIPVPDWKKMVQKSREDDIKAMMENFEEQVGKFREHCKERLDSYCDRLEDLGFAVGCFTTHT